MNLGFALAKGVEGAANAGSGLLDEERKRQDQIASEERAADTRLKLEERLSAIREASDTRAAEHREKLRREGKVSDFQFETNPENVKAKGQAAVDVLNMTEPVKAKLERESESAKMNDPAYLAGLRKKAQATHIESASSIAAANLSKLQYETLLDAKSLQKDYQAAIDAGDADKIAKLERKIAGGKITDKKDAGDYIRGATQLYKAAETASTPEEAVQMKEDAKLMLQMAGVKKSATPGAGAADANDPLGIRKPTAEKPAQGKPVEAAPSPRAGMLADDLAKTANGSVSVADDPILKSLTDRMAGIDARDPANQALVMALGKAKNDRLEQLQEKYGSMTKLRA